MLAIARQIAEALEATHEKGIVHRDLKPRSIMLKSAWGPTPRAKAFGIRLLDKGIGGRSTFRKSDGTLKDHSITERRPRGGQNAPFLLNVVHRLAGPK